MNTQKLLKLYRLLKRIAKHVSIQFTISPARTYKVISAILLDLMCCDPQIISWIIKKIKKISLPLFNTLKKLHRLIPSAFKTKKNENQHHEQPGQMMQIEGKNQMRENEQKPQQVQEVTLTEQDQAYENALSCMSKIEQNDPTFIQDGKQSMRFYSQNILLYYEELITMKNNCAFSFARLGKFEEAIHLFKEAISLQERFYSTKDQRKLGTLNNLICAYCQNKQKEEAIKIWQQVSPILERLEDDNETRQFFKKNVERYLAG